MFKNKFGARKKIYYLEKEIWYLKNGYKPVKTDFPYRGDIYPSDFFYYKQAFSNRGYSIFRLHKDMVMYFKEKYDINYNYSSETNEYFITYSEMGKLLNKEEVKKMIEEYADDMCRYKSSQNNCQCCCKCCKCL